jgi:hypothetical protein
MTCERTLRLSVFPATMRALLATSERPKISFEQITLQQEEGRRNSIEQ